MSIDFDRIAGIHTSKSESRMDSIREYNRYEPTPYDALRKLLQFIDIDNKDHIVDLGSGKGRAAFFLNYYTSCKVTGVEVAEDFYKDALKNLSSYRIKTKKGYNSIFFVNKKAEEYEFSPFENKIYLFNPFTIKIFIKVINNLIESYYENKRKIELIMYYPDDDCINYLEEKTMFSHVSDIYLDTFFKDSREKFSIYRLDEFHINDEYISIKDINIEYRVEIHEYFDKKKFK